MKDILCKLGFHKKSFADKFYPNILADFVTDYEFQVKCDRCNEILVHEITHFNKDGSWASETL